MKLHFHPVSTASRPIVFFCLDANIPYEPVVVDLMSGAHLSDAFKKLNPSAMVPVLEDGDFVLTESSAILKYIAEKNDSPAYPKDLKQRARVNERMDWINTNFYREFAYHLVYPQVFPNHTRTPDVAQSSLLAWGKEKAEHWLTVLDRDLIGTHAFIAGDQITIADYFAAQVIATGDLIGASLEKYPNVSRWMGAMRDRPAWKKCSETLDGFAASLKGKPFVTIP